MIQVNLHPFPPQSWSKKTQNWPQSSSDCENDIFTRIHLNLHIFPHMLKSWLSQIGLSLVQALRITSQEFRSNFLFWQIARAATNFLFSTGLTKSTRQSGKHERVHGQTEFDKKAQLSLQSDFFSGAPGCGGIWWLVGSKHNLPDFWPPGRPFRPSEGSTDDLWDSRLSLHTPP